MADFNTIYKADGLSHEDSETLKRLVAIYNRKLSINRRHMRFYEDKNAVRLLNMAVPDRYARRIGCRTGWAGKTVDYLASRSIFNGVTATNDEVGEVVSKITRENNLQAEYSKSLTTELVYGCGFWTVSRGAEGEQKVIINYHNAETACAILNYRKKRIEAGFVIEDYEPRNENSADLIPSCVMLHTCTDIVEINAENGKWVATYYEHQMGRPCMEVMGYRPSDMEFGKSRITSAVMDIIEEAQREITRTAFHSEVASKPLRYLLGIDEEAFDADRLSLAYNSMLLATKDADGDTPEVGQLESSSPEHHIKVMEHYMSRMSGETGIPVSSFGLASNGYTSSDALRASSDDLILEAESLNRTNGKALECVVRMALAIYYDKSYAKLTDEEKDVAVRWRDPSMPSVSSVSDALVKQVSAVPEFGGTTVFWEKLGYNEEEIRRITAEVRENQGRVALNDWFANNRTA